MRIKNILMTGAFTLGLSGLTGCGAIADAIEQAAKDLQDAAVQAAFDAIKQNLPEGAVALLVTRGQAGEIKIDDTSSPIYGAAVSLPADALPEGVEYAALTIATPPPAEVPEGAPKYPMTATQFTGAGNPAVIEIVALPGGTVPNGERFALATSATVTMPYDVSEVTGKEDKLGMARTGDDGETVLLAGTKVEGAEGLFSTDTTEFSIWQVALNIPPIPELPEAPKPCGSGLDFNGDGSADITYTYEYDEKGNKTREIQDNGGGELESTEWTYDTEGNITRIVMFWPGDNVADAAADYTYVDGKLTQVVETDGQGNITRVKAYTYNPDGSVTESLDSGNDGSVETTTVRTYDQDGNLLTEVVTDQFGTYTYTYTYEAGVLVSDAYDYGNDGVDNTTTYTYNLDGSPNQETTKDANNATTRIITYNYECQ